MAKRKKKSVRILDKRRADFPDTTNWGSDQFAQEIIKTLAKVSSYTGLRPADLFDQWLEAVKATLERLPEQFKAIATTGSLAPDPPEVAQIFKEIEKRQRNSRYDGKVDKFQVWTNGFAKAFHLLLESSAPGLWDNTGFYDRTACGPDILGYIYETWSNSSPQWRAQYFTSWNLCRMMSQLTTAKKEGEHKVLGQLKEALIHPDNIYGSAVLLAGLLIPETDTDAHNDWFFNRMIPAALSSEHFKPITVCDPTVGSGRMLLAAALEFPPWAVQKGIVQFYGQDIDYSCYLMTSINVMLYGLNSYGIRLELAVSEGMLARQNRDTPATVYNTTETKPCQIDLPSFQDMYRVAELAMKAPVA